MFHMLIVEDNPDTLELMCEYLEEAYKDACIHPAKSIREALDGIAKVKARGERFKIAILDFALPQNYGEQPDIETKWLQEVQRAMTYDGAVFHITSYPDDLRIKRYMQEQLKNPLSGRPLLVPKNEDNTWTLTLYATIDTILASNRIIAQMDHFFPVRKEGQEAVGRGRFGSGLQTDPSHDLAALCREAAEKWTALDEDLKDRIREVLYVNESDPKRVTVETVGDIVDQLVGKPRQEDE
jgi:CheY-like chemotaxis protein